MYNALDQRNGEVFVNDVHSAACEGADEEGVYYDESGRQKSLFGSSILLPICELKVGAEVISVMNLSNKVNNGCRGTVTGFTAAADGYEDMELEGRDLPYGTSMEAVKDLWPLVHPERRWQIVLFKTGNGEDLRQVVRPHLATIDDSQGDVICSRMQLPLLPMYAMTISSCTGENLG